MRQYDPLDSLAQVLWSIAAIVAIGYVVMLLTPQ